MRFFWKISHLLQNYPIRVICNEVFFFQIKNFPMSLFGLKFVTVTGSDIKIFDFP